MDSKVYKCPVTGNYYDPFRLIRRLHAESGGKVNEWIKNQRDPEILGKLIDLGRAVFGLDPINPKTGKGDLDSTVEAALTAFSEYCRGKGNGAGINSKSSVATDSRVTSAPKKCSGCP